MRDMLAEIVEAKKDVVARAKEKLPLYQVQKLARSHVGSFGMSYRFRQNGWNLIAECKLKSPSKGDFGHGHTVAELAQIYERSGAAMLSVHTDEHFLGKNDDVPMVKKLVSIPVLRKEFIIDKYQIFESRMLGADAVLLIARILSIGQLKEYLHTAWSLGMDALVEVHDEADMQKALATQARFIGINNRNLKYFRTTIQNTLDLLPLADKSRVLISESGIHGIEEARMLRNAGLQGILVGEGLSTAPDVGEMTRAMANA